MMLSRKGGAAALAVAGIVAGHALTYSVVVPDHHERAELLASSGHSYWPLAVFVAIAAFIGGLVWWIGESVPERGLSSLRLASVQCGGYLTLELVERLLSGGHEGQRLVALVALGCLIQLAFATACFIMLRALRAMVTRIVKGFSWTRPHAPWAQRLHCLPQQAKRQSFLFRQGARGPPLPV